MPFLTRRTRPMPAARAARAAQTRAPAVEALEGRRLLSATTLSPAAAAAPGVDVLTYHDNNARTGLNDAETTLAPSNVNADSFGKLATLPVDGQIYAQPLVVSGITAGGKARNVVYVATEHDSVYAFDADTGAAVWKRSFVDAGRGITPVPSQDVGVDDIAPEIGITATPVIDRANNAIYFVTKTKQVRGGTTSYHQQLHALDLATGSDKFGGPTEIAATVPGQGVGTSGIEEPMIRFDPLRQLNRPGLSLVNGRVYIAWGSHGDILPYHGWVMSYDAKTLKQVDVFNTTPEALRGAIWQGGGGAASDGTNLFYAVGNGTFDVPTGGDDHGLSILKLTPDLKVADSFTPANQFERIQNDIDTGSTGTVLTRQGGKSLILSGTKAGDVFVNDANDLGGFHLSGDRNVQTLDHATPDENFSTPAVFNGAIYIGGKGDQIKRYAFGADGKLQAKFASQSPERYGFPGATVSISSNGTADGIVWAIDRQAFTEASHTGDATPRAVLRAYDATDMTELYNSADRSADDAGVGIKFGVPTVANGKVFVGTADGLSIFGETAVAPPTGTAPAVKRFALVDADTGRMVDGYRDLNDGDRVNLSALGVRRVTVLAYAAAGPHGSTDARFAGPVAFDFDRGSYTHIERHAPYALFGDSDGGTTFDGRAIAKGSHTVSASVGGGAAYAVSFEVV